MSEQNPESLSGICHSTMTTGIDENEVSKAEAKIEELEPSVLGTKEHWDDVYKDEMNVFEEAGVVDEGWFGSDVETKVLRYFGNLSNLKKTDRIVDLGCGNGALLFELATREYINLTGIDYSEAAITLATALFKSQNYEASFHVSNMLEDDPQEFGKFSVCLDKGTFDAISLCPDVDRDVTRGKYFQYVLNILEDGGTFILISCNWTTVEIETLSKNWFNVLEEIPTQKFSFGGHPGNLVSIVVMKKK